MNVIMPLVLPVCPGLTMEQKQQQKKFQSEMNSSESDRDKLRREEGFYGSQP